MSILTSILGKWGQPITRGRRRCRPTPGFRPRVEALEGRVVPAADLSINISGPLQVTAGTDVTYPVTVSNLGPGVATGINVSYTLPRAESFVSFNAPSNFALPPFASVIYNLRAHVSADASPSLALTTSASVSSSTADPDSGNNTDSARSSLVRSADLSVTVTAPSSVVAGSPATYRVTLTNNGPSDVPSANLSATNQSTFPLTSSTLVSGPPVGGTLPAGQSQVFDEVFSISPSIID